MRQVLIRNVDDALAADYRAAARVNGRSVEAEYRAALERARPRILAERRAMAEEVRALLPTRVPGPEGVEIIRWFRDTSGGRDPDAF